jgi:tripartite-type tricarboxylate transporter receptor subunit TctC
MDRMKLMGKALFLFLLLAGVGVNAAWPASPSWPSKDITLIVPFSPGGGFDTQSRIFAPIWEKKLPRKVNVIVSNQKGAGGKIGSLALMKSPPDGYKIGTLSPSALALMQINGELEGFDIRKLSWLGQLSWEDGVVVVSAASGIKTVQDLTKREIRFGITEDSMFPAAMLAKKLGMRTRMVMFDGTPEQNLAAMRGDVDIMMDSVSSMKRAVVNSQGKLVPLFTVSDKRSPDWPEVPSSKELGKELGDLEAIAGSARLLGGPTGIQADLLKVMQESTWKALQDSEFKAGMEKAGYVNSPGPASEASKTVTAIVRVLEENKDVLESLKKK